MGYLWVPTGSLACLCVSFQCCYLPLRAATICLLFNSKEMSVLIYGLVASI